MKQKNSSLYIIISFSWLALFISSCNQNDYSPKPRGYFRIDLPEKSYVQLDTNFPYIFEYPSYSVIKHDRYAPNRPYWINIAYPDYNGQIHLSYKQVNGNLAKYVEDSYNMAMKHIPKASAIKETRIRKRKNSVYGITYRIGGTDVASPYQFYVTDSANHFLRGALYFNIIPNNDSLEPVIDFVIGDIQHMLSTLKWKEVN